MAPWRPILALAALAGGCAGPREASPAATAAATEHEAPAQDGEPTAAAPEGVPQELPAEARGAHEVLTNAGSYRILYRAEPEPIPWGELFALRVWIAPNDPAPRHPGEAPRARPALVVDAAMPEHGHGMNHVPAVSPTPDGGYDVQGLLFHMPGRWELYFDVVEGAVTERAQVEVVLE